MISAVVFELASVMESTVERCETSGWGFHIKYASVTVSESALKRAYVWDFGSLAPNLIISPGEKTRSLFFSAKGNSMEIFTLADMGSGLLSIYL